MTRTRIAILLCAVLGAAGGAWYYLNGNTPAGAAKKPAAPPAVPVKLAKAEVRDVPLRLEVTGRTEAYESVTLKSRVEGQVSRVPFAEGQHVRQGDLLVQLDPADYQARQAQAEANLAKSQAQAAKARADVERYVALREKGFVSEEKVGEMRTAAAAAEAVAKADGAAAELARLQLSYTAVRAPFAGVVGAKLVSPGAAVKLNDTALATVNRVRPLYVGFAVPESTCRNCKRGCAPRVPRCAPASPFPAAAPTGRARCASSTTPWTLPPAPSSSRPSCPTSTKRWRPDSSWP